MNNIINTLPDKNTLLQNFQSCTNWEEKYLYIIELGNYLPAIPQDTLLKKYLIPGCQSKVWVVINIKLDNTRNSKKIVEFYGDSDSIITKGILYIIFIIYQGFSIEELIRFNPLPFFKQLELTHHLTYSRSQGIKAILQIINTQARKLQSKL